MDRLDEEGLGLVLYEDVPAGRVPAVRVSQVLDANREPAPLIRVFLQQAAARAKDTGQAVVVAHGYPETVTALYSWAQSLEEDLTLAPVSALLR
nr:divergent polysaccharide deacetylase family protein [Rhodovulum imhoffii]